MERNVPKLRFKGFNDEWRETTFKNIFNNFEYGMNSAAIEFDGKNKYIRITDIDESSNKYSKDNMVSPDGILEDKFLVKENDILFARTGASVGKTYLYNIEDGKLYFAGFLIRGNVKKEHDSRFIFMETQTENYRKWVNIISMRSGQPGINSQEYSSYNLKVPSLEEQERIANFLTKVDKIIEKQDEKVKNLEKYKKGMIQKIFSQEIRFKDENGEEYPEWEYKRFGDITKKTGERNKENKEYKVYSISNKYGFIPQEEQFEESRLDSLDKSAYKIVYAGDFAYNPARINVGSIGLLDSGEGIVSSLYVCFRLTEEMNNEFYKNYFSTFTFNKDVIRSVEGGVREYLFYDNFIRIKAPVPCFREQNKIAEFLDIISKTLNKEAEKLNELKKWKKGLLQQMFV